MEECTSELGLVSCELESPSAAVGPIDTDDDPELIWAVRRRSHRVQSAWSEGH